MKTRTLLAAALASVAFAIPAHADGDISLQYMSTFDRNKDGMISKAEAMKMAEEIFAKADKQKKGMLDKKETEDFLKMLANISMGG